MSEAPRTLADQFRSWPDSALAQLLTARPDLSAPAPRDSAQLASRAGTRASILRAVDQLTMLELTVIDAAVALGGTATLEQLQRHINAEPDPVESAVDHLLAMALLWGSNDDLRVLSALSEAVGTTISGLGQPAASLLTAYGPGRILALAKDLGLRPSGERSTDISAISDHLGNQDNVSQLLADVDEQAHKILGHLDTTCADGMVESTERSVTRRDAHSPVDQLLARGLLLARDRQHVAISREVGICLRAGKTTHARADQIPIVATSDRAPERVDRAAAGAAFELVRHVELLVEQWGITPPPVLRAGGLGVRDLRAVATLLHVEESVAALVVELVLNAGLIGAGQTDLDEPAWLPTDAFDVWATESVAERWTTLAQAWLDNPRLSGLIGSRVNGKPVNALSDGLERSWLPGTRRAALDLIAALPVGTVLASGTGVASVVARLRWLRPRRPAERTQAIEWVVDEAATIGLVALGGMASFARVLLDSEEAGVRARQRAAATLEPLLPAPVDHVLLQADLTAVAPGPLEPALARNIATVADVESRGGATVYRFSANSVRRAFDSGWSVHEVHAFLVSASPTPVPQPLVYLVDDVSRRFGTVRVGAAASFLRSDDEAALTGLLHDPGAASLRLRRIAPTVIVSDVPLDVLLPRLRERGAAPVVEAADGTVRVARKRSLRARTPKVRRSLDIGGSVDATHSRAAAWVAARASATVTAIRDGDRAVQTRPTAGAANPTAAMALLREAVEARASVAIGYVDKHGSTIERIVDPVRVEDGWLNAYDHRSDDVRSFAVHRITSVAPAAPR